MEIGLSRIVLPLIKVALPGTMFSNSTDKATGFDFAGSALSDDLAGAVACSCSVCLETVFSAVSCIC